MSQGGGGGEESDVLDGDGKQSDEMGGIDEGGEGDGFRRGRSTLLSNNGSDDG
jgi:hypothetical protein